MTKPSPPSPTINNQPSANHPIIQTTGLTKVFKDFWNRTKVSALTDLNLRVNYGEIYGLLGPNGSGKSTTLKLLLGLLHPTNGNISIMGKSPRHISTRQHIGYLPEESQLYQHLTAIETLNFYGKLFGLKKKQLHERTDQLLEMVGLTHAATRPVGDFSKGMARRIGLAQALINDPNLLILDEPTAGLDPVGCRQIKDLLLALAARGKTVIISSHLLADMEDVCDRIMLLHNGHSLAEGSIHDLLTSQNSISFSFSDLTDKQELSIKKTISKIKDCIPEIDIPKISLEDFFISTIDNAAPPIDTPSSGVANTTKLAPFLSSNGLKD